MPTPSLTRSNLRGVWAALVVPWTKSGAVDESIARDEVSFYAGHGLQGVYTGGTTGEFYAQDDQTFELITRISCRGAMQAGIPIQIGATALSNRTAAARIRVATDYGADAIQIAIPFWLELSDDEVVSFVEACTEAAGPTPIVIYNTSRCKRKVKAGLIGRLAREFPTVIGMKDTGCSVEELKEMLGEAPDLSIFSGEPDLMEKMRAGGTGCYCSFTGLNPRLVATHYTACAEGRWEDASRTDGLMKALITGVKPLLDANFYDSAIDRVIRAAGGGKVGLECQGPYRSAAPEAVEQLQTWCKAHAPEWLAGS